MRFVTMSDAKKELRTVLQDVQREPVTTRKEQEDVAVILLADEYARPTSTNIEDVQHVLRQNRTTRRCKRPDRTEARRTSGGR